MFRPVLYTAMVLLAGTVTGCGWTGRSPTVSPPSMNRPASDVALESVTKETDDKPQRAGRSVGISPASKPRPSLDEMFLFQPLKIASERSQTAPLPFEDVDLESGDGTRLRAWWAEHPQPVAVVLYLHGNGGNLWYLRDILRWLHETAACSVLAVDYRGYGESEGTPTVAGVLEDVRAARAETARRGGIAETHVVLLGRSLGGALAIQSAKETPPRGLILESTFTTLEEVGRVHLGKLAALVPDGRLDSVAALAEYSGPLLHSHGDADRVIPFEQGQRLHEVVAGPKRFIRIPNGNHNDAPTPEYLDALQAFLHSIP